MRKIYQKKKQVNCFRFLTKRPDVQHDKKGNKKEGLQEE